MCLCKAPESGQNKKNNHNPHTSLGTPRAGDTVPLSPVSPPLQRDEEGSRHLCREIPTVGVGPSPGVCPSRHGLSSQSQDGLEPVTSVRSKRDTSGGAAAPACPPIPLPSEDLEDFEGWGVGGEDKSPPETAVGLGKKPGSQTVAMPQAPGDSPNLAAMRGDGGTGGRGTDFSHLTPDSCQSPKPRAVISVCPPTLIHWQICSQGNFPAVWWCSFFIIVLLLFIFLQSLPR